MEKEILAAIEKDLPNQVGVLLKERLEQAESDKKKLDTQLEKNKILEKLNKGHSDNITKLKNKLTKHSNLLLREDNVLKKEREIEITSLKNQLTIERDKSEFAKNVALGLVRNTNYRKQVFDKTGQMIPFTDEQGCTGTTFVDNTKAYSEDTTEE